MSTKTLGTIQKLSKIGKIFSMIVMIFSIIGAVGCVIGIAAASIGSIETLTIGGVTFHSIIESSASISIGSMYAAMITGIILCVAEAVIAGLSAKYFKNELAAGTPFTLEGAKELLRLGICTICISIGSLILAGIAYEIINNLFANVADMEVSSASQAGIGIAFIIISILCKYGAEKEAEKIQ